MDEVRLEYDDFGQVAAEYQSHSGAVNTGTTPQVAYAYADGSANTIRPTTMTYPDGRELNYDYGAADGMGDAASRIAALVDDDGSTHLADYAYLGRGVFVEVDYAQPDLKWTMVGTAGGNDPDTGDIYRGFDRFTRVKDNLWYDYGSAADADRIKYGYDRASNRIWRENALDPNRHFDELYAYDRVHRLRDMERGTLAAPKTAIDDLRFAQCWSLDETGNWGNFREDDTGDGQWDLVQQRTSNPANEITVVNNLAGPTWATPAYDRAGNMTTVPKPADPATAFTATYDAWNRLVKMAAGSDTVAEYRYDGRKRRIVTREYVAGVLDRTRHHYFTSDWQEVEERLDTSTAAARQHVWGQRYIDDLVLRDRDTDADGTLDERLFGLQDANWNMTAIADTAGDVQERYAYAAYGMPVFLTGGFASRGSSAYSWETLFAGYRWESSLDMYAVRRRFFLPNLGFWANRDPVLLLENHYEYCISSAPNSTDPTGLLLGFLCWPWANDIIENSVASGNAPAFPQQFLDKTISTITRSLGCIAHPLCLLNILRPDIVLVPPIPGPAAPLHVFEIKQNAIGEIFRGFIQIAAYVRILNTCGCCAVPGSCLLPGTAGFQRINDPVLRFFCGDSLTWQCQGGLIVYNWGPNVVDDLAAAAIIILLLRGARFPGRLRGFRLRLNLNIPMRDLQRLAGLVLRP